MSSQPPAFCCDISNRGRLRLTGEDRVRFLNGQLTNDVKILSPNTGCYAAFTTIKGKMRADVVILNIGDALLLDFEPGCETRIASELDKFIIADDVVVENITQSWSAFTVIGEKAPDVLKLSGLWDSPSANLWEVHPFPNGFVFRSRRSTSHSFDVWVESTHAADIEKKLIESVTKSGGTVLDASALEISRVEAGIPRFGKEMDENTLPPEAGIESIAISYTKGCYLGQEVIARIKSIGHVNRELVRLSLPNDAQEGQSLSMDGKEVGKLGSAVTSEKLGRIGLAIVRSSAAKPETQLDLPSGKAKVVEKFI